MPNPFILLLVSLIVVNHWCQQQEEGETDMYAQPNRVPTPPNLAVVHGQVVSISQETHGINVTLSVNKVENVPNELNFVEPSVQQITGFVHEEVSFPHQVGDSLSVRVTYLGDERGGRYVFRGSV